LNIFIYLILPSSVQLAISIATELALLSLFPTPPHHTTPTGKVSKQLISTKLAF
jgi:hypothetical protein